MVHALLDDAQALPHFLDAHRTPVITVAVLARWDVELEVVVARIRLPFTKVPVQAASAEVGTGNSPLDGFIDREATDPLCARLENEVPHDRLVVFDKARWKVLDEIQEHLLPALGQVCGNTADSKPRRMHPRARNCLNDAEGALTIVEGIKDGRHLSHVLGERAIPDQVADDTEQLRQHDANHLGASRNRDAGEFLDGGEIGQIVHYTAQVIHAVGVGYVSVPGLALTHLFSSAVVEADFRNDVDDLLAIELQGEA